MPTYEYRCPACESIVEVIHGVNDPPPRKCPQCGARRRLEKQLSAPAFQFKGSGWYVTDYARKDKDKGKSAESSSGDSKSSKKESDSKDSSSKDSSSKDSTSKDSSSKDTSSPSKSSESKKSE